MNHQAFAILEFNSLRALVRHGAQTAMARARIDELEPSESFETLHGALRAVAEAIDLRQHGARFSFASLADPAESIARLKIEGAALDPRAILDLVGLCNAATAARETVLAERENCRALFELVAALPSELKKLAATITKKILPNGEIDDRASPELARIRHEVARQRSSITRSLENLMRRSPEAIQEELVTVRNDRFVIPVRADHRGRINGVAHGSSSSGATIFVEPMQTIEANNELQTLREAEQREIAEILFRLSEDLRTALPGIEAAAQAVAELDFLNAKAVFAEKFNCVVPVVSEPGTDTTLEFIDARHPLLEESLRATGGQVVPVSLKLDERHPTMVISGANAGGKTVVLKTTGLLTLMALSGLPVPARAARVPFYASVLADIGDHQSLAANLSTFTSHVANIASMFETCELPALVMFDEVGTGTDPEEGSALGVAVVDHFKRRGAHVLATTHYSGLKMFAANEPGVLNASVEFDEKTLQPTYRLLVGVAGSSSGLEIARRFGIPTEIITSANQQVKESTRDAIEYLRRIKREADEAEALRKALEEERAATAEKFATLDRDFNKREQSRQAEFEKQLKDTLAAFETRARDLIAHVEARADRVKVEREAQKRSAELKSEAQRALQAAKKPAAAVSEKPLPAPLRGVRVVRDGRVVGEGSGAPAPAEQGETNSNRDGQLSSAPAREMRAGDRVRLLSFGSIGIVDEIKGEDVQVRVGSIHLREKLSNLELLEQGQAREQRDEVRTGSGSDRVKKPSLEEMRRRAATTELHLHSKEPESKFQNSAELNLIGKKTDEAIDITDKFLDEAFLNGLSEVRIIHGHGTGALRKAVTQFLDDHPHVARYAQAPQDKGGSGATIVELHQ
ncbi:MAG TPA: Smr/MutS family protein [Pyrinomonadaceae bacterium]|nr:Smr/MutS family protein [Pyrinomonadaceae bacterium]